MQAVLCVVLVTILAMSRWPWVPWLIMFKYNKPEHQIYKIWSPHCSLYLIADNKDDADLWILNSCTVKNPAEDHFRNEVNKGRDLGKKVVVAGCVPQGQPRADYIQVSYEIDGLAKYCSNSCVLATPLLHSCAKP